jgi:hypothetical protein
LLERALQDGFKREEPFGDSFGDRKAFVPSASGEENRYELVDQYRKVMRFAPEAGDQELGEKRVEGEVVAAVERQEATSLGFVNVRYGCITKKVLSDGKLANAGEGQGCQRFLRACRSSAYEVFCEELVQSRGDHIRQLLCFGVSGKADDRRPPAGKANGLLSVHAPRM